MCIAIGVTNIHTHNQTPKPPIQPTTDHKMDSKRRIANINIGWIQFNLHSFQIYTKSHFMMPFYEFSISNCVVQKMHENINKFGLRFYFVDLLYSCTYSPTAYIFIYFYHIKKLTIDFTLDLRDNFLRIFNFSLFFSYLRSHLYTDEWMHTATGGIVGIEIEFEWFFVSISKLNRTRSPDENKKMYKKQKKNKTKNKK